MEFGNLREKMIDAADDVLDTCEQTDKMYTHQSISLMACFPMDLYRHVEADGEDYQLHIHYSLKKVR